MKTKNARPSWQSKKVSGEFSLKKVRQPSIFLKASQVVAECRRLAAPSLKIRFISNKTYRKGSILSLGCALPAVKKDAIIMDADVYFPTALLAKLVTAKKGSVFLADIRAKSSGE